MNQARAILESLADLDLLATDSLYKSLLKAGFVQASPDSDYPMFIFPDGRMLGSYQHVDDDGSPARKHAHRVIYQGKSPYVTNAEWKHPAVNEKLAKYHNIIIIEPEGEPGADHGVIMVPDGVEPTQHQLRVIADLMKIGNYRMEDNHKRY